MKKLMCTICVLLLSQALFAHDLFLRPAKFKVSQPERVLLSMWLAEAFPGKEIDWRADKTADFRFIGPKESAHPDKKIPMLDMKTNGTFIAGWSSTPSYIEISAAEFRAYVKEEGYKEVLRSLDKKQDKPGREKYVRYLKAYLQAGNAPSPNFSKPLGYKIEIIPLSNPYSLISGQPLAIQVLFDGKPLAGASVMATYDTYSTDHDVYAVHAETDVEGKTEILIEKPGVWMIRTNHMLPEKGDPKADWQSFWANISFEVK